MMHWLMKSARWLRGTASMMATTSSVALKKSVFAYFFLRPLPWRAPPQLFSLFCSMIQKKFSNFAGENPKVGGFPLPVGCQIPISNLILTFQILNKIASFIRLSGFRFSYSLQGFRIPLCQSLLTIQRYEKYLKLPNYFKIILFNSAFFAG